MKRIKGCVFLLAWVFLILGCQNNYKDPYTLIEVHGPVAAMKLSPGSSNVLLFADSGRWRSFPFKEGDVYILPGDDLQCMLRYGRDMPDSLQFTASDSISYLNNRLFQVRISSDRNVLPFLNSLTDTDKRNLKTIRIDGALPESYLPALQNIAKINPRIDLHIEPDSTSLLTRDLLWLSTHFKPSFLAVDMETTSLEVLASFNTVDHLYLAVEIDSNLGTIPTLPAMPELKMISLILNRDEEIKGKTHFFPKNAQLESITISSTKLLPELMTAPNPGLRQLNLAAPDSLLSLPYARYWPNLESLHIYNPLSHRFQLEELCSGQKLHELSINGSLSQTQLNTILDYQTNLRWLEINAEDTLVATNYTVLKGLRKLRYLILSEKMGDTKPVESMKQLRFLSVPTENAADSLKLDRLEKALPNTKITPNGGFCMGSGWLLLLLPISFLGGWILRRFARG